MQGSSKILVDEIIFSSSSFNYYYEDFKMSKTCSHVQQTLTI